MRVLSAIFSMFIVMGAFSAHAVETRIIDLDFYDQQYQGSSVLKLKQEIQRQTPRNFNFKQWTINRVVLFAKSKQGRGQAALNVGYGASMWKDVYDSRQGGFQNNIGYHQIAWTMADFGRNEYIADGPLQIALQGNIKVKQVKVILAKKAPVEPIVCHETGYFQASADANKTLFCLASTNRKKGIYCEYHKQQTCRKQFSGQIVSQRSLPGSFSCVKSIFECR